MPRSIACRRASATLPAYAVENLPAATRRNVERHLETCAACRRELETYRRAISLMESAGQTSLPASRANWQMLADRMETLGMSGESGPAAATVRHRLSLAGAAALALLGVAYHGIRSRKPDRAQQIVSAWSTPQKQGIAPMPHGRIQSRHSDAPSPFSRSKVELANASNFNNLKRQALMTPAFRPHHAGNASQPERDVRRLLALAASKIDAIERQPASQRRDVDRFLAALRRAQRAQATEEASTLAISIQAGDRMLQESSDSFTPTAANGGIWLRQTLLEQPDGARSTDTLAVTLRPDSPHSYFSLQTCAPVDRRSHGDLQP